MSEMQFAVIPMVIYPFDLVVFVDGTYDEIREKLKTMLPESSFKEVSKFEDTQSGRTYMFSTNQIAVWFNYGDHDGYKILGLIAHELFHVVTILMDSLKVQFSMDCDEPYAYLIDYLTQELFKAIKFDKIAITPD